MIANSIRVVPAIAILSLSLALLSCGKRNAQTAPTPAVAPVANDKHELPVPNIEEAEGLLREAYVNCNSPTNCHPSVGMLAVATSSAVSTCTAWLVSDDIIATNSHCIPNEMRDAPASCQGHMKVLFPRFENYGPTQAYCAEILEASDFGDNERNEVLQDYAFVRLAHSVARPALEIDRSGFAESDKVKIIKVDPYTGVIGGNLTSVGCEVTQSSLLMAARGDDAPFVVMAGCETNQGNSGAPILDSSGRVRGIFHRIVTKDEIAKATSRLVQSGVEPMVVGTNFSCVQSRWVKGAASTSSACMDPKGVLFQELTDSRNGLGQKISELIIQRQTPAESALRASLPHWLKTDAMARRFEWDVRTIEENDREYRVIPEPKCLKPSLEWLNQYRHGFLGRKYDATATGALAVPTILLQASINGRLEVGISQLEVSTKSYSLELSPDEIKKTLRGPGKSVNISWNGARASIPFCSE